MAFHKLNRKYLPTFIYLMDSIEYEDLEIDYQEIADFETKKSDTAHKRSISRAFKLRTALKEGWTQKPGLPSKATLNVMAAYYEKNKLSSFLKFHLKHKDKIEEHFSVNTPNDILVDQLFPKRAEKISHLETQLETTELYSNEVETNGMTAFVKDVEVQFKNFKDDTAKELKWQTEFIHHLKNRIDELESILARAEFMNSKFGVIGLFFVSIDYGPVTKESLLTNFTDSHEGFDDDFWDDLV